MKRELFENTQRIIVHAHCPDGMASAMILTAALPEAKIEFVQYNSPEHIEMTAEADMLFCDITPHRSRVDDFVRAESIVLDHHRGAKDIVDAFGERGVFADEEKEPGVSGAVLAFREVYDCALDMDGPNAPSFDVSDFATLAGIRDTWQRESHVFEVAISVFLS